jgi:uncharacterized membrane protein YqjE
MPRQNQREHTEPMDMNRSSPGRPGAGTSPGRNPVEDRVDEARQTVSQGADSLGAIVGGIIEDLQAIVRGEVQLAKTELKEEATQMGKGAGMAGAGVFFGLVGFIFLMLSLTYLLAQWMDMWIAAGIVGLALAIIAAILVMTGKNQISEANLAPQKTIDSVKEDKEWASRQINSVKK